MVEIGFAGSRRLFESPADPEALQDLHRRVREHLIRRLESLPNDLNLGRHHFLCGISQVAIGADTAFTEACRDLGLPQRVFLPQPMDAYLEATGPDGVPDFTCAERANAERLLSSPHIIHQRVVSDSWDRTTRFEDPNREILRVSDVIICLLSEESDGKPGGALDLMRLAGARDVPTLEIRVGLNEGEPIFRERWHGAPLSVPRLPEVIAELPHWPEGGTHTLISVAEFCRVVKEHVSAQARRLNVWFSKAALTIIATHILATLCATLVLAAHPTVRSALRAPIWVVSLLLGELVLLATGLSVHWALHKARPSRLWALSRLLAEINRSVEALGNLQLHLGYLFRLRLPVELVPLLRTLNVLHLRSTRALSDEPWESLRDAYVRHRLTDPDDRRGQVAYYENRSLREERWLKGTNAVFSICSGLAVVAVIMKVGHLVHWLPVPGPLEPAWDELLGTFGIVLPVLAVGALSWAAAMDYEARVHIYAEMAAYLKSQGQRFEQAVSRSEFELLVGETESRLLGETAEWYSRRTFVGVA